MYDGARYNKIVFWSIIGTLAFGILMLYLWDNCLGVFEMFC